jgi:hypothetical protein
MKMCTTLGICWGIVSFSLGCATASFGPDPARKPPTPPPEAVAACLNQVEGATVEFSTPQGELVKATCRQMGTSLVAVAPHPPADAPPEPAATLEP